MRTTDARYDRTLRTVMWLDALAVGGHGGGRPGRCARRRGAGPAPAALAAVGVVSAVAAVLLAAFGAVTGVLLMLRLRAGHYLLPPGMRPRCRAA